MTNLIKKFKIEIALSIFTIVTLYLFIRSFNTVFGTWVDEKSVFILIISSFILVLLILFGVISMRKVWNKQKKYF